MRKVIRFICSVITTPFRFIAWIFKSIWNGIKMIFNPVIRFFSAELEETTLADVFEPNLRTPMKSLTTYWKL